MGFKMLYRFLFTKLKYFGKLRPLMLFIVAFTYIIIIMPLDLKNRSGLLYYVNTGNNHLVNNRLKSYTQFFGESSPLCNTTEASPNGLQQHLSKTLQVLTQFRQQALPLYPEDYFNGRGIVLTAGILQIAQSKVNLKMMERTGTRLPVQVKSK
jgi:hypothetical protein